MHSLLQLYLSTETVQHVLIIFPSFDVAAIMLFPKCGQSMNA